MPIGSKRIKSGLSSGQRARCAAAGPRSQGTSSRAAAARAHPHRLAHRWAACFPAPLLGHPRPGGERQRSVDVRRRAAGLQVRLDEPGDGRGQGRRCGQWREQPAGASAAQAIVTPGRPADTVPAIGSTTAGSNACHDPSVCCTARPRVRVSHGWPSPTPSSPTVPPRNPTGMVARSLARRRSPALVHEDLPHVRHRRQRRRRGGGRPLHGRGMQRRMARGGPRPADRPGTLAPADQRAGQLAAQRALHRHRHRRRQAVVPDFGEGRLLAFDPHSGALAWSFAHGASPAGRSGVTRSLPFARHRVRGLTGP